MSDEGEQVTISPRCMDLIRRYDPTPMNTDVAKENADGTWTFVLPNELVQRIRPMMLQGESLAQAIEGMFDFLLSGKKH